MDALKNFLFIPAQERRTLTPNTIKIVIFGALIAAFVLLLPSANGQEFSTPINISNNPGISYVPEVIVDGQGNINVIWLDTMVSGWGYRDIFFSRSDDGINFCHLLNISNNSLNNSGDPAISVDSQGNIYVAWGDDDTGNFSIFISKGIVSWPPVANAGVDQTVVDNTSPLGIEPVILDGSASYDPDDDDLLSYLWTWAEGSAYGENPTVQFAVGTHIVTLTVTDLGELSDSSHVIITVLECNPTTMIDALVAKVQSFNLQNGIENSLDVKLSNAKMSMDSVRDGDIQDAINKLQAFIKECEAQRGNKLTVAQADDLIDDANTIAGCLQR